MPIDPIQPKVGSANANSAVRHEMTFRPVTAATMMLGHFEEDVYIDEILVSTTANTAGAQILTIRTLPATIALDAADTNPSSYDVATANVGNGTGFIPAGTVARATFAGDNTKAIVLPRGWRLTAQTSAAIGALANVTVSIRYRYVRV